VPSRTIRGGRAGTPTGRLPASLAFALAAALGATSACSATPSPAPASAAPSSGQHPTTRTATPSPGTVTLDEHARHRSVRIPAGTTLVVRLHSTYWSAPTSSDPGVLGPAGGGSSAAGSCPPGGGCGLTSARFTAARPGTVRITAHRSSCGEAMRCSAGQGDYQVTVTVSDPRD
jgi:hypothetical protein